jgi:hypothetical protein
VQTVVGYGVAAKIAEAVPPAPHDAFRTAADAAEVAVGRIIPYFPDPVSVDVPHDPIAGVTRDHIPIHPDADINPADVTGQLFPDGTADLEALEELSGVVGQACGLGFPADLGQELDQFPFLIGSE